MPCRDERTNHYSWCAFQDKMTRLGWWVSLYIRMVEGVDAPIYYAGHWMYTRYLSSTFRDTARQPHRAK